MQHYLCRTCGTQYSASLEPPESCAICNEERQYVHPDGQTWTTLEELRDGKPYQNKQVALEPGLTSITTTPSFAIGQSAYLVETNGFRLLWDCIAFLDDETMTSVKEKGGLDAIALSHPHYYSTQVEWAEAFDCPIYIHEDDQEWVQRPSDRIIFWSGDVLELHDGLTIHRLGGHYRGGAVLHWAEGNEGKGILLTGDIIQIVADQGWVSFMYSYPNLIPLPASKVKEMAAQVKPIPFDRIYHAFHKSIREDANGAVQRSAERYVAALEGKLFQT